MFRAVIRKPAYTKSTAAVGFSQFNLWRGLHDRAKKAKEFIAKGFSALQEVDRVIDHCEIGDKRLIPMYRRAKENFELALEADNTSTEARYWLGRLHIKYPFCPGVCKAMGAAFLVEAAEMGNADAQYELGCQLRGEFAENSAQQAFVYLEMAVDQLHPGALYLLGAVYLTGDCVQQDVSSAMWCFHRASEKGHAGAAIVYGRLLLAGCQLPESITKFKGKAIPNRKSRKNGEDSEHDPVEMAREQFEIAANAGCDLGLRWLKVLEEEEKEKEKKQLALSFS